MTKIIVVAWNKLVAGGKAFKNWLTQSGWAAWEWCLPVQRTRKGVSAGALAIIVMLAAAMGSQFHTGLGTWLDILLGGVPALLMSLLAAKVLLWVTRLVPQLPRLLGTGGLGAVLLGLAFLLSLPMGPVAVLAGMAVVSAMATVGGTVVFFIGGGFRSASTPRRVAAGIALAASVGMNAWAVLWLLDPGSDEHLVSAAAESSSANRISRVTGSSDRLVELPDVSQAGKRRWRHFTYGSGDDRQRPEFAGGAKFKAKRVDGRPFLQPWKGWRANFRKMFWGFDEKRLPLNGRVWMPEGEGLFPLVLMVHGNHNMAHFSDPGYTYLGEHFASHGYIAVSVDENFLNSGLFHEMRRENDARAWLLLEHLRQWREWHSAPEHPLQGKVDLERVALIGHSRGGEAVAIAAVFNRLAHYPDDASVKFEYNFGIRAVTAIAPVDGQYRPADKFPQPVNVNYLVFHGGHDSDVSSFVGDRTYNRVQFADASDWFKTSVYIDRANHGQFNTLWGVQDIGYPLSLLLNRKPLLPGEEQRLIAKLFMTAFLEAAVRGDARHRALFRDYRAGPRELPAAVYVTRYEDTSFRLVADFEEDVDLTTATLAGARVEASGFDLWLERDLGFRDPEARRQNNVVVLGWGLEKDKGKREVPPRYVLRLPGGYSGQARLDAASHLVFAASQLKEKLPEWRRSKDKNATKEHEDEKAGKEEEEDHKQDGTTKPLDLTIELVSCPERAPEKRCVSSRVRLSQFRAVPPLPHVRFTKSRSLDEKGYHSATEAVLQSLEIPLGAFEAATPGFRAVELREVRFIFDGREKGAVALDRIGFAR